MASAAEQLAANLNFSAFAKAEELKKRIWFTLGAMIVYRIGTYIPLPGIDPAAWQQLFQTQAGGILGMFNMFSGGGINRMAIFALNIMPYISASIIIQLLTSVSPTLEALKKEGESGRKVMNQYTRYLTVVLAVFQAYGISVGLEGSGSVVSDPGWFFRISTTITLTGGTMFLMWLGEQVTSRGIGNGISLIIMAGIVAELPSAIAGTLELGRQGFDPLPGFAPDDGKLAGDDPIAVPFAAVERLDPLPRGVRGALGAEGLEACQQDRRPRRFFVRADALDSQTRDERHEHHGRRRAEEERKAHGRAPDGSWFSAPTSEPGPDVRHWIKAPGGLQPARRVGVNRPRPSGAW